jgi:hypothetical protein
MATVTDSDSPNFAGGQLTVAVTTLNTAQDLLAIGNQGIGVGQIGVNGTSVTYNPGTGAVVIGTFTGGTGLTPLSVSFNTNATPAATQALVRDITFGGTTRILPAGNRVVTFTLSDGAGGTATATRTINVAPNHAPVLTGANNLNPILENPSSNPGTSVAALIAGFFSDPDVGSLAGIAVDAANNTHGSWQFSLDGGTSWSNVGSVSDNSSLALRDIDVLRFVPQVNFSGSATISFRGWDQTSAAAGIKVPTAANGGSTAFSTAIGVASVTVTFVNQAPVVTVPSAPITYRNGKAPTYIADTAMVSDVDSADFDTGSLTVSFVGGTGDLNDRLGIGNAGLGGSLIGVSGPNVTFGTIVIGTWSGGTDGFTPLVITFNANVTPVVAQTLLRAITYRHVGGPVPITKTLQFVLDDGDGGISVPAVRTIHVV